MKAQVGFSFQWIFAIVAGGFILFLVVYGVNKIIDTGGEVRDIGTSKEIGILLNPLETGFETGKKTSLILPVQTRIYNKCGTAGNFGKQVISTSQKDFGEWSEQDTEVSFENKYIFSEDFVEGNSFYLFSKPFEFPFKTADLIYLTDANQEYCFMDAPEEIAEELSNLKQKNILIENCSEESLRVCFKKKVCDINVNYNSGIVEKRGVSLFFESDALMYAGIFSDPEIYECQVKRLMKRLNELALLYKEKSSLVSRVNCNSNLELDVLAGMTENLESSANLHSIKMKVDDIDKKNEAAKCRLW
jgi:hypothetical protein